jgi:signal transduction histidine kinase
MKTSARDIKQAGLLTATIWCFSCVFFVLPSVFAGTKITGFTILSVAIIAVLGTLVSAALYAVAVATRASASIAKWPAIAACAFACSLTLSAVDAWLHDVLLGMFSPGQVLSGGLFLKIVTNFIGFAWLFGLLGAIYVVLQTNAVVREREQALVRAQAQAAEAEAAASASRLAALRYQLNPHFLFNTLNAISAMVITNRNELGEAMLGKLSDFLRATLAADPDALIPLEDELATLQSYLEIESIRFGERLAVEFSCPADLDDALVPSFLLQPLVENAIKYAVAQTSRTVTIGVEARQDGGDLVLLVEDDGDGAAGAPSGTGVGLANVRQRLEVLYGARGSIEAVRRERGFLALLRFPLERSVAAFPAQRGAA